MQNIKIKYFLIILALTFVISGGIFVFLGQNKGAKIFGCTQYDIYEGQNHTKIPPQDLSCNLDLLEMAPNSRANDITIAFVEYDLNLTGYLTVLGIFIILPFIISYCLILLSSRITLKRKNS